MTFLRSAFRLRAVIALVAIMLAGLSVYAARAQDENMWCGVAWACEAATAPAAATTRLVIVRYMALAIAGQSLRVGASYGEPSAQAAAQTALMNCARNTSSGVANPDCSVVQSGDNTCLAIAVSLPEHVYAYSGASASRLSAWNVAMAQCRLRGGKSCFVQTTPCASDDARYPTRFPLASGKRRGGRSRCGRHLGSAGQSRPLGVGAGRERHL
jgi:hypothetical protein